MQYLVSAAEMKAFDEYTIKNIGIPSLVLMERAALAIVDSIKSYQELHNLRDNKVLIMVGVGNNGGDGLAVARLLVEAAFEVEVWIIGDAKKASAEWKQQYDILQNYSVKFCDSPERNEYTIMVDALFGVGLSREVNGVYANAIELFNAIAGYKIAVDLPSGIHSDNGSVMGIAVRADETVTFELCKRGLVFFPGCGYCGKLTVASIGINKDFCTQNPPKMYGLDENDNDILPERKADGNKGSFGKVLLITGSLNMAGAAILSGKAAYRIGAGMVKILTVPENREIIQCSIPEALFGTYEDLEKSMAWADVIAIGPGYGTSNCAKEVLKKVIEESNLPLLLDADALNLISEDTSLFQTLQEQTYQGREVVMTPHPGELARLCKVNIPKLKTDFVNYGMRLATELQAVVVAKDARTVICSKDKSICVNLTGNSGLATAGSGDVLAGMIIGLMAQGMEGYRASCVGAYLHGAAGDRVTSDIGAHACMAGDLIEKIPVRK